MELMSSPLTLELTRHELFSLPPHTPAVGEAVRVEVSSCGRPPFFAVARFVINAIQEEKNYYRAYFREENRPENEILSVYVQPDDFYANGNLPSLEELLRRIPGGSHSRSASRFWMSPELPYGLCLTSVGQVQVVAHHVQHRWNRNDFQWGDLQDERFWSWDQSQLDEFCWGIVNDPDSQLHFFFNWQKLEDEEKTRLCLCCEHGDWNFLSNLSKWVLQLSTHHFGTHPGGGEKSSWHFIDNTRLRHYPFLARWQNALCNIVKPSFWPDTPVCVYQWRYKMLSVENSVTCEIPTMHEVLEAQFGLREFLRPHLSAEEIEALFLP